MNKIICLVAGFLLIVSCSGLNQNRAKIKYKSSKSAPSLSFPPDLVSDKIEDSYAVPGLSGIDTLSQYDHVRDRRRKSPDSADRSTVLPVYADMRIIREGNVRWIRTSMSPAALWPKLKDFWEQNGLALKRENKLAGIMETNWAENRAELATGPIRKLLSRVIDAVYSTGTRDKYRLRLERAGGGMTDILMTHQRMVEKLAGEHAIWTPGRPQPALESEMLALLMAHLGGSAGQVSQARKSHVDQTSFERARLVALPDKTVALDVFYEFANSWRLVGAALERAGFAVTDKNRSTGLYYVTYEDPLASGGKKNFFSRIFSSRKSKKEDYMVSVRRAGKSLSRTSITDRAGKPLSHPTAKRILTIIHEQLK